jgi:hypothetical protein
MKNNEIKTQMNDAAIAMRAMVESIENDTDLTYDDILEIREKFERFEAEMHRRMMLAGKHRV